MEKILKIRKYLITYGKIDRQLKGIITERYDGVRYITTNQQTNEEGSTPSQSMITFLGTYEMYKEYIINEYNYVITREEFMEHTEKIRIDEDTRTLQEFDAIGNTTFWSKEIIRNYSSVGNNDGQVWTRIEKTEDKI